MRELRLQILVIAVLGLITTVLVFKKIERMERCKDLMQDAEVGRKP